MASHAAVAAKVRREKEEHPERFCHDPRCLWRVETPRGPNPCRKHPVKSPAAVELGRLGGQARAANLTPEQRSESARQAALARFYPPEE